MTEKIYKIPKESILSVKQTKALLKRLKAKAIEPVNGMYDLSKLGGKNKGYFIMEDQNTDERLWK